MNDLLRLRFAYWFGAVFDAAMLVPLLVPAAAGVVAVTSGLVRLGFMAPIFVSQAIGSAIFITAHHTARRLAADRR